MEASAQAAEVMGQASEFLFSWTKEFAQNTAAFAQAWLQNEPRVRRSYLDALDQVSFTTANFYNQLNARATERLSFLDSLKQEEKMQKLSLIVGSVTSLVGFGLGAAFGTGGGAGGSAGGSIVSSVMDRLMSRSALERSASSTNLMNSPSFAQRFSSFQSVTATPLTPSNSSISQLREPGY
jgi:hypothetical protein